MSASAFNIYQSLWSYYGSDNLPKVTDASGVFFGFHGYTVDKLIKTIEALKGNSKGWFTSDFSQRNNALNSIASELAPGFGVDPSAILGLKRNQAARRTLAEMEITPLATL